MKNRKLLYLLLTVAIALGGIFLYLGNTPLKITKQPESVVVSYPEGATFTVEVNHPRKVASYQWILIDQAGNKFIFEGVTAKTNRLVIPSTVGSNAEFILYCEITAKDGTVLTSETATLNNDNGDVNKPVFYVGEYAIEPGESLDLSKVDIGNGTKLGKGTVSYDANGTDITLDNVYYSNEYYTADPSIAANVALCLDYFRQDKEEYNIIFKGHNEIYNDYYDYDYNAGGISFDFYFNGETTPPLVNFIGDGDLTITNGSHAIRVIGDLMVDIDITVKNDKRLYGDGIVAQNLMVNEGRKLDLEVYGSGLVASGNLYLKGAEVNIDAYAPHISVGMVAKSIVRSNYTMRFEDAKLNISAHTDRSISQSVGMFDGITAGELEAYDSEYKFSIDVLKAEELYVSNISGITAGEVMFDNCKVDIDISSRDIFSGFGIYSENNVLFTNDSDVKINVYTNGQVFGIAPEMDCSFEESNAEVTVASYDDYGDSGANGIMCENLVLKLTEPDKTVKSSTKNGLAVGCTLSETSPTPWEYVEDYNPKNIYLREGTVCVTPQRYTISYGNYLLIDLEADYLLLETFYDLSNTDTPAKEVVFTSGNR